MRAWVASWVLIACVSRTPQSPSPPPDGDTEATAPDTTAPAPIAPAPIVPDPTVPDPPIPGPTAGFAPAPPAFWYVDTLPLAVGVGGAEVTHYRHRLDGGAWSDETEVSTPITLGEPMPAGLRTLEIIGKNAAGGWQTTPTAVSFHRPTIGKTDIPCTAEACDYIIPASATNRYFQAPGAALAANFQYFPATGPAPPAGSRICLQNGAHGQFSFANYTGTAAAPITITNCGGVATIAKTAGSGGAALSLENDQFIRVVGVGSAAAPYGIVVTATSSGTHGIDAKRGTSDFEVAYIEVNGARNHGIDAKSDSSAAEKCSFNRDTFVQRNTFVHHVYMHDVYHAADGGWECMYMGSSHWNSTFDITCGGNPVTVREHELVGVRVHDSRFENCGNEGIQIGGGHETAVYRNRVINAGLRLDENHSNGIQFSAGTRGLCADNFVKGAAFGLRLTGPADTQAFNNVLVDIAGPGIQTAGAEAVPGTRWVFAHNTMVNVAQGACQWGAANVCYCNNHRAICHYDTSSNGSVYYNNLAPNTDAVPDGTARLSTGNNVTSGMPSDHFEDPDNDDYRLSSTSTALGAGRDVSSLTTKDHAGNPRPATMPDAGAFERPP